MGQVMSNQDAVNMVRHIRDPPAAAKHLTMGALARSNKDDISRIVIRFGWWPGKTTYKQNKTNWYKVFMYMSCFACYSCLHQFKFLERKKCNTDASKSKLLEQTKVASFGFFIFIFQGIIGSRWSTLATWFLDGQNSCS